ncbi:MAG: DUF2752 domain-containing protein [Acidobacteriaceae bacterium]|jgi:hypothetical protein
MSPALRSPAVRKTAAHLSAAAFAAAAWILWRFPPASSGFYPRCLINETFHIDCPGCGGTRAVAALLHGRLAEALHFNPLVVILLPFILAFFGVAWFRAIRGSEFRWPVVPEIYLKATLVAALAFTVMRNLPHGWLR